MSPTFGAGELLVELGDDGAAADLVEVALGGEAGLMASPSWEPAMSMVTWSPSTAGAVDLGELGELLAEVVDALVDLLVGGLGRVDRDPQARRSRRR